VILEKNVAKGEGAIKVSKSVTYYLNTTLRTRNITHDKVMDPIEAKKFATVLS